mmetsp:Transcript_33651/g.115760  ORF Transcript_33651/g.115760 Transcript_33651/m.115760 type:complete len:344 (+) Transcript_33651:1026-2057(+)
MSRGAASPWNQSSQRGGAPGSRVKPGRRCASAKGGGTSAWRSSRIKASASRVAAGTSAAVTFVEWETSGDTLTSRSHAEKSWANMTSKPSHSKPLARFRSRPAAAALRRTLVVMATSCGCTISDQTSPPPSDERCAASCACVLKVAAQSPFPASHRGPHVLWDVVSGSDGGVLLDGEVAEVGKLILELCVGQVRGGEAGVALAKAKEDQRLDRGDQDPLPDVELAAEDDQRPFDVLLDDDPPLRRLCRSNDAQEARAALDAIAARTARGFHEPGAPDGVEPLDVLGSESLQRGLGPKPCSFREAWSVLEERRPESVDVGQFRRGAVVGVRRDELRRKVILPER